MAAPHSLALNMVSLPSCSARSLNDSMSAAGSFSAPDTWLMEVSKSAASWNAAAPVAAMAGVTVIAILSPADAAALPAASYLSPKSCNACARRPVCDSSAFCCTTESRSACS